MSGTVQRTSDEIFDVLGEDFRQRVVRRAIEQCSESKALCDALGNLQVDGFRDASRAPKQQLLPEVLKAIRGDQALARAVLNAWMDSQRSLRDRTAEHLAGRGIRIPGPPDARFDSFWTVAEWRSEHEALAEVVGGSVDSEAAGLMLCLLARRFPSPPPLRSRLFRDFFASLRDLPPDAPEWEEASVFTKWTEDLQHAKADELMGWRRKEVAGRCRSLRKQFGEELQYLGIDTAPWPGLVEDRPALAEPALDSLNSLKARLAEYGPVRPQASTRIEELERAAKRAESEDGILATVKAWQDRVDQSDPPDEDPIRLEGDTVEARATPGAARVPVPSETESASRAGRDEDDSVLREVKAFRRDRARLEEENRALRAENAQMEEETGRLRGELSQSQKMEEQWRAHYVELKKAKARNGSDEDLRRSPPGSVREAIAQAEKEFPDRLFVKLNSRSTQDTPFLNPREVFDALAWLATEYRNGPANSITEACPGWHCKEHQSAAAMGQYPEWYRTEVDGTAWELKARLGKGKSRDPRHTIRIAFAWDESNDRAIVGFVGRHQRNRAS